MDVSILPLLNTTDLAPDKCPHCHRTLEAASSTTHVHLPSPGDVTVCAYCAEICVFTDDMKLRKPTCEEGAVLARDPEIAKVQEMFRGNTALVFRNPNAPRPN